MDGQVDINHAPVVTTEQSLINAIYHHGLKSEVEGEVSLFFKNWVLKDFKPAENELLIIQKNIASLVILAGIEKYKEQRMSETRRTIHDFQEGILRGLSYRNAEDINTKFPNDEYGATQRGAAFAYAFKAAVNNEPGFARLFSAQDSVSKKCLQDLEFATRSVDESAIANIHGNLVKIGAKSPLNIQ